MDGVQGRGDDRQFTLHDRSLAQQNLPRGQLQGHFVVDRSEYGLSNNMIGMYAISLLFGGYFWYKGLQTDDENSRGNSLQTLGVGLMSFAIVGFSMSLARWHTALQWQNIFNRLHHIERQVGLRGNEN